LLCKPIHRALVASKRLSPILETNQRAWLEKTGASTHSDESRHPEIPAAAEKAPERTARVAKLMGKRSNFLRRANDDYPTPAKAVCPLLPHAKEGRTFIEPCAGTSQLTKHLAEAGLIPLRSYDISQGYDARVIEYPQDADFFITNPPWTRQLLHPIIVNLCPSSEVLGQAAA
jgi:hypothetical protein